jgi:nicotinate-nucleotide--dimethylbenzimidazole phosphoribosyltransferase
VSEDLPAELAAVVARITAPEPSPAPVPGDVTGVLADLDRWWRDCSQGGPLVVAELDPPAPHKVLDAVVAGIEAADRAVDAGASLIVPRAVVRDDEAARTLIALLTRKEASAVVFQPDGMRDRDWMTACAAVRDRAATALEHRGEPVELLSAVRAPGIALVAGALLAAAARRTPCLIDGTDELAAALVADRLCFRAKGWWWPASDSPDPGRAAAIDRIDLPPGLPFGLTDDVGRGAQATVALLGLLA